MKKVLLTGAGGFVGHHTLEHLLKLTNWEVVITDSFRHRGVTDRITSIGCWEAEKHRVKLITHDLTVPFSDVMVKEIGDIDYIISMASDSHVDRSILNPEIFLQTNIIGTQVLMDACRKYGIKRYHQVSTDEVYGTLGETGLFTEKTPYAPNSPYSASKASADMVVRAYNETYGLPVNITRCSNNYGPYQFPEKLIPLMINNCLSEKDLPIYGDGMQIRDWLHVYDHCTAIDLIIHNGRVGEVYNIGGHNERTNVDVVKTIIRELGKSDDLITYVKDRPGHDMRYAIDPTKIENELGWTPIYNFDTGILDTIKWYLDNKEWWQKIMSGEYLEYMDKQYKQIFIFVYQLFKEQFFSIKLLILYL